MVQDPVRHAQRALQIPLHLPRGAAKILKMSLVRLQCPACSSIVRISPETAAAHPVVRCGKCQGLVNTTTTQVNAPPPPPPPRRRVLRRPSMPGVDPGVIVFIIAFFLLLFAGIGIYVFATEWKSNKRVEDLVFNRPNLDLLNKPHRDPALERILNPPGLGPEDPIQRGPLGGGRRPDDGPLARLPGDRGLPGGFPDDRQPNFPGGVDPEFPGGMPPNVPGGFQPGAPEGMHPGRRHPNFPGRRPNQAPLDPNPPRDDRGEMLKPKKAPLELQFQLSIDIATQAKKLIFFAKNADDFKDARTKLDKLVEEFDDLKRQQKDAGEADNPVEAMRLQATYGKQLTEALQALDIMLRLHHRRTGFSVPFESAFKDFQIPLPSGERIPITRKR
jgi:hypothetical protein